jgi:hypothetical protein
MPPVGQKIVWCRRFILTWLIAWVTTVPLFHIHLPDTTAYDPVSVQRGLAHTVYTPDLPGEFSCPHDNVAHLSHRVLNSPEFGFAFLNDQSKDRRVGKPTVVGPPCCLPTRPLFLSSGIEVFAIQMGPLLVFGSPPPSRGPPSIVSL